MYISSHQELWWKKERSRLARIQKRALKTPNALADHARHGGEGRAHLREAGVRRCIRLQAEMEKRSEREEAELGPGEAGAEELEERGAGAKQLGTVVGERIC